MTSVVLQQSPTAIFQYPIDGLAITTPDSFRPRIGDQLRFDHVPVELGTCVPLLVFVVGIEWRLTLVDSARHEYASIMHLMVSSEVPPQPTTRRAHEKLKR